MLSLQVSLNQFVQHPCPCPHVHGYFLKRVRVRLRYGVSFLLIGLFVFWIAVWSLPALFKVNFPCFSVVRIHRMEDCSLITSFSSVSEFFWIEWICSVACWIFDSALAICPSCLVRYPWSPQALRDIYSLSFTYWSVLCFTCLTLHQRSLPTLSVFRVLRLGPYLTRYRKEIGYGYTLISRTLSLHFLGFGYLYVWVWYWGVIPLWC